MARAPRTSRASQLDAALLDDELAQMLEAPLTARLATLAGGRWRPELTAAVRLAVVGLGLAPRRARTSSYGARLAGLQWLDRHTLRPLHPTRAALYAFLAVVPAYIHARIRDHMLSGGWPDGPRASTWPAILASRHRRRTLWELVERLDLLRSALQLATLLRFLHNPRHPRALLDRILNISLRPLDAQPSRTVAFDFLHRQIDFILFILPLIDLRRLRLRLRSLTSRLHAAPTTIPTTTKRGELSAEQCPMCVGRRLAQKSSLVADPADPRPTPPGGPDAALKIAYQVDCCNGLYCYACLLPDILRWRDEHLDEPWTCWRCARSPSKIHRWNGT
ncbi:hypothetical protein PtA15_16A391 [Puccinia triticina]|uniref:Pex N-terminal domain-containing protein n=1 Tax=Puccinia triticina TaxID=208348 RepID=A0ABY7D4D8_9BASI|nr:uncharacterized protein PtA15_16A391 [Puccinia triticina]WAQ92483.1 hypothetical protein PtA15_16A391 [Puccinia triticina]